MAQFIRWAAMLIVALILSALSVLIERTGPELGQFGNLCGPTSDDPCLEPLLKGGYPVAYLFDTPGLSVEHRLSFGEDMFYLGAFTVNSAVYLFLLSAASFGVTRFFKQEA